MALNRVALLESYNDKNDRESAKAAARQRADELKVKLDQVNRRLTELVKGAKPKSDAEYGELKIEKQRLEAEYYRAINTAIWGP